MVTSTVCQAKQRHPLKYAPFVAPFITCDWLWCEQHTCCRLLQAHLPHHHPRHPSVLSNKHRDTVTEPKDNLMSRECFTLYHESTKAWHRCWLQRASQVLVLYNCSCQNALAVGAFFMSSNLFWKRVCMNLSQHDKRLTRLLPKLFIVFRRYDKGGSNFAAIENAGRGWAPRSSFWLEERWIKFPRTNTHTNSCCIKLKKGSSFAKITNTGRWLVPRSSFWLKTR